VILAPLRIDVHPHRSVPSVTLVQKPFDFDELFSILSRAVPRVSAMTQKSAPG
jgi:hypothetical protein